MAGHMDEVVNLIERVRLAQIATAFFCLRRWSLTR